MTPPTSISLWALLVAMKWYNHLSIDIEIVYYFISEVNKWFWIVQIIELILIFLTHEVNLSSTLSFPYSSHGTVKSSWCSQHSQILSQFVDFLTLHINHIIIMMTLSFHILCTKTISNIILVNMLQHT